MSHNNKSKERGTAVEVKVRDYMRAALGQPGIDRQPLRGRRDAGDLAGLAARGFGAVVEVKAKRDVTRSLVAEYRRQTLAERESAGAGVGILVVWRYNHPAADAVAHVTLRDLARLSRPLRVNEGFMDEADGSWVSMTLGELCALISDDDKEE